MKFTGICLITRNISAMTDFYTKVLGVEAEGDDVHVELKIEGATLAIFAEEEMEKLAPLSMQGAGWGNFTIGLTVTDVDVEYERLNAIGVNFVMLPTTHPWGRRSFFFRDPDGNLVSFASDVAKLNHPDDLLHKVCPCKIGENSELYPKSVCTCSAEFYRPMFAPLFSENVVIEPFDTVLSGDEQCTFAIRLGRKGSEVHDT